MHILCVISFQLHWIQITQPRRVHTTSITDILA